jgi:hypothetical protein
MARHEGQKGRTAPQDASPDAIRELIRFIERSPQGMTSFARATQLAEDLGFRCRLAVEHEVWQGSVTIDMLDERNARPIEVEFETPFGRERVLPLELRRAHDGNGNERIQRRATVRWPMDRFGLLLERGRDRRSVTIYGPGLAKISHAWLADDTDPAIAVDELAEAIAEMVTGGTVPGSTALGAGFRALETSEQAVALLRSFLEQLESGSSDRAHDPSVSDSPGGAPEDELAAGAGANPNACREGG